MARISVQMLAVARKGPLEGLNASVFFFFKKERYKNDVGTFLFRIKDIVLI